MSWGSLLLPVEPLFELRRLGPTHTCFHIQRVLQRYGQRSIVERFYGLDGIDVDDGLPVDTIVQPRVEQAFHFFERGEI